MKDKISYNNRQFGSYSRNLLIWNALSYHHLINPRVNPADILPDNWIPKLDITNEKASTAATIIIIIEQQASALLPLRHMMAFVMVRLEKEHGNTGGCSLHFFPLFYCHIILVHNIDNNNTW